MTQITRKNRNQRKKNVAIGVAAFAFAFAFAISGTTVWAQFPGFYSNTVQPQLNLQNQARASARPTSSVVGGVGAESGEAETLTLEALLVAVEEYESGEFRPLNGCANDVRALKGWLDSNFSEEYRKRDEYRRKVVVLSDDAEKEFAAPTRDNILNALKEKASLPCDRLFVSFAGHGVGVEGKSYLCTSDALNPLASGGDEDGDETNERSALIADGKASDLNLIAISEILEILKRAKAKEVILLLDACRNGNSENSFMREFADLLKNPEKNFKKGDGGAFYILTSCSFGEEAREVIKDRQWRGAFGYYFVEGLAGPADYVGCCDGAVSLIEAYNYAYSKTAEEARSEMNGTTQTPEIFMANVGLRQAPTMARVRLDDLSLADVDAWRDQAYLLYVGRVLSDVKWTREVNEVGVQTLNCVLEGAPNNSLALSLRGSLRRKLGDYDGALDDWNKVGQKLQLYVKSLRSDDSAKPPRNAAENLTARLLDDAGQETGASVASTDLLTISEIKTDATGARLGFVVEKNNVALGENAGWLPLSATVWNWRLASRAITATEAQATGRLVDYNASSGVAPGRNYIQGGGGGSTPGPLYH